MVEIMPIRRKTLSNQSVNQSLISLKILLLSAVICIYIISLVVSLNATCPIGCNMSVCYVNNSLKRMIFYKQHSAVNDKPFCFIYHFFGVCMFFIDTCMYVSLLLKRSNTHCT